jgi:hypothetical protein
MPLPKQPYVASPDQVRITRKGDYAIIEYADSTIATTHLKMGADRLAAMTDAEVLGFWNEHIKVRQVQPICSRHARRRRALIEPHVVTPP